MVNRPDVRSPEAWRKMAAEARKLAEGLATDANRQQLIDVAKNYERLAEEAEREQTQNEAELEQAQSRPDGT